jgi:hypothetical protein
MTERMDPGFAVFNLHINDARPKAEAIFIAQFGQEKWDEVIRPLETAGIMSVFGQNLTFEIMFYITTIMLVVNGDLDVPAAKDAGPGAANEFGEQLRRGMEEGHPLVPGSDPLVKLGLSPEKAAAARAAADKQAAHEDQTRPDWAVAPERNALPWPYDQLNGYRVALLFAAIASADPQLRQVIEQLIEGKADAPRVVAKWLREGGS